MPKLELVLRRKRSLVTSIVAGSELPVERRCNERWSKSTNEFRLKPHPLVRTVASTQSEMTEIILPNDANTLGNLLGGRLMHFIDLTGAMAAYRHSRTHVVTAAMDHIDFIQPVHVGDLLILKSSVNRAFNTSLEVGVKVWVEHPQTGSLLHVASAYLVFVAIDEAWQSPEGSIPCSPKHRTRFAATTMRCAVANIAKPKPRGANMQRRPSPHKPTARKAMIVDERLPLV